MSMNSAPEYIGITMGCPVGIGPEIILRLHDALWQLPGVIPVIIGDLDRLVACAAALEIPVRLAPWQPGQAPPPPKAGTLPVLACSTLAARSLQWGRPNADTGRAMARYVEEAVRLVQDGTLAAMVTCPITKEGLKLAGYRYPGHTEMLAALCQSDNYGMMLAGKMLRVTLVTIHRPLAEVPAALSIAGVEKHIRLTALSLVRDFGIAAPRLAVAGLNPHAGEAGMFGNEEESIIAPAVSRVRGEGWLIAGPLPPDTVFHRAAAGEFDAVVCMYHDQGLIPFKLLHFADGVNLTIGLPLVRTSVDHGTAYDIAGRGSADPASLQAAYALAVDVVRNRRRL